MLPPTSKLCPRTRCCGPRCRCGCTTKADFPRAATASACYGPGIRALAAYLAVHQHLPMDRMAQLFSDVLSAPISVGALAQMVTEAADATRPFTDATRLLLQDADIVHFDETGGRAAGRLHWVHSASTSLLTLLDCNPKLGRVAMDDLGVIGAMSEVGNHDGWRPHRHYDVDHALCNAHQFDAATLHSIRVRYGQLVAKGFSLNPAPAVGKRSGYEKKAFNLLVRLDGQRADVLRFITDFTVLFDNYADVRIMPMCA